MRRQTQNLTLYLTSVILFMAVVVVNSLPHQIPVQVLYEDHQPFININGRNLQHEELTQTLNTNSINNNNNKIKVKGVENLSEKVQLSQDELGQAIKHLPLNAAAEVSATEEEEEEISNQENKEKIVVPEEVKPIVSISSTNTQGNEDGAGEEVVDNSWHSLLILQQAQEIVTNGLDKLKSNLESSMQNRDKEIDELNQKIMAHLKDLKQQPPSENTNVVQNIVNFIQSNLPTLPFGQNNNNANNSESDNASNNRPNNWFSGVIGNITQSIQSLNPANNNSNNKNSTVLGDAEGSTTQNPGFFQQIVSNFIPSNNQNNNVLGGVNSTGTNFFQNLQNLVPFGQNNNNNNNNNQGDEQTSEGTNNQGGPLQGFQNFASSIQQTISNFIRPNSTSTNEGGNNGGGIVQSVQNQLQQIGGGGIITPTSSAPASDYPQTDAPASDDYKTSGEKKEENEKQKQPQQEQQNTAQENKEQKPQKQENTANKEENEEIMTVVE